MEDWLTEQTELFKDKLNLQVDEFVNTLKVRLEELMSENEELKQFSKTSMIKKLSDQNHELRLENESLRSVKKKLVVTKKKELEQEKKNVVTLVGGDFLFNPETRELFSKEGEFIHKIKKVVIKGNSHYIDHENYIYQCNEDKTIGQHVGQMRDGKAHIKKNK